MAYYGNSLYSLATYGTGGSLVDFDASPMVAKSTDYGKITVTWAPPSGAWDLLHLVRNTFGFPMTPDDGDLLVEQANGSTPSYSDTGAVSFNNALAPGQVYYYAVFVRKVSDQKWYKASEAIGLSVYNYGTADLLYDYLPQIYKTVDTSSYFDGSTPVNTDLYNFLKVFAFEHDYLKTMAQNVKSKYNMFDVDARLLVPILNQFGITYEREIGIQQARKLAQNAANIYIKKGSAAGLKNFITAYSGYSASLLPVKNLMLNVNDSSFETGIGGWEQNSNTTISQITGLYESPVVTPYVEATAPSNFPNGQKGLLKVVATASGTADFSCGLSAPKTNGIPVTASSYYSFSVYGRNKTAASHTITVNVKWYDMTGTLISTSSNGTGTITNTGWSRVLVANQQAPSNAYFAVPHVTTDTMSAGEIIYFDAAQFEQSTTVTNFVDARRIDILLNANRINWIANPNVESATTNWGANLASIARITTDAYVGSACVEATFSGTAGDSWVSPTGNGFTAVTANSSYTFSIYVKDVSSSAQYQVGLDWYTPSAYISTSSGSYSSVSTSGWTRITVTGTAPATATKVGLRVRPGGVVPSAGTKARFDAALLEQAVTVNPYFDGTYGYYQADDLLWENGTPNAGRSFYYKNYQTVFKRLLNVTGDYVPFGAPWALFVAQTP